MLVFLAAAGAAAMTSAGWAQSPTPAAPNTAPAQPNSACAPGIGADAPTVGSGQSDTSLSDRLARSGGVICPPASSDSGMAVPPPRDDAGRMPVIPPPGAPGGDQNIQPK